MIKMLFVLVPVFLMSIASVGSMEINQSQVNQSQVNQSQFSGHSNSNNASAIGKKEYGTEKKGYTPVRLETESSDDQKKFTKKPWYKDAKIMVPLTLFFIVGIVFLGLGVGGVFTKQSNITQITNINNTNNDIHDNQVTIYNQFTYENQIKVILNNVKFTSTAVGQYLLNLYNQCSEKGNTCYEDALIPLLKQQIEQEAENVEALKQIYTNPNTKPNLLVQAAELGIQEEALQKTLNYSNDQTLIPKQLQRLLLEFYGDTTPVMSGIINSGGN